MVDGDGLEGEKRTEFSCAFPKQSHSASKVGFGSDSGIIGVSCLLFKTW